MRIISIANQKGGCGKTTTAINLAASLSVNGKRTLLIDLDPQAHASLGLNFQDQDSLYNVISKLTPKKLDIFDIILPVEENFDIVPSSILVGTLEQELVGEIGREIKLTNIISKIKDRYDYILIDCPPSLGFLTINAIRASDEVFIPVETSRFSMQGVEHLKDIVHLIRDRLHHLVSYKILITMFDSRLRHSFLMLAKIRERFTDVLFDTIVHTNVKLKESVVMGKAVIFYDKYCRGSKDYFSLAKEIIMDEKVIEDLEGKQTEGITQEQPQEVAQQSSKEQAEPVGEKEQIPEFQKTFSPKMQALVKEESKSFIGTTFNFESTKAQSVYVTGSFNDWSLDEAYRLQQEDGRWSVDVPLKPGIYKYQFIVDGRWCEDPANPYQERNSFGEINSLIEVKEK